MKGLKQRQAEAKQYVHLCEKPGSSCHSRDPGKDVVLLRKSVSTKACLVVHGGAGAMNPAECDSIHHFDHAVLVTPSPSYPAKRISAYKRSLCDALVAGNRVLEGGGSSLDAAVAAVRVLEGSCLFFRICQIFLIALDRQPAIQLGKRSSFQCRREARARGQRCCFRSATRYLFARQPQRRCRYSAQACQESNLVGERAILG